MTDVHSSISTFDLLSPATVQSHAAQPQSPLSNLGDASVHDLSDVTDTSSEISMYTTNSSHLGKTINVFAFKPRRCKRFQFPVFLLANICGGYSSKLNEFQVLFNDNNIDIAVLTETWLRSDIHSDNVVHFWIQVV